MKSFLARAEPQDAGSLNIEQRFPFFGTNNIWNYSDNFSAILGSHSTKFGVFVEYGTRNAARSTSFNGTFNFDRDANNPLDSGYAYSNALLGVVDGYTESNGHPGATAATTTATSLRRRWRAAWCLG